MTDKKIKFWTPGLDVVSPIDESQLPQFAKWVQYNCFRNPDKYHEGFDFAAFLDSKGICYLGLPSELEVRAIIEGVVTEVIKRSDFLYNNQVTIQHEGESDRMYSGYCHIAPIVKKGDVVEAGQPIGRLVHQRLDGRSLHLIHLHLGLVNIEDYTCKDIDGYTVEGRKKIYHNPVQILFPNQRLPSWKQYRDTAIVTQETLDDKIRFP